MAKTNKKARPSHGRDVVMRTEASIASDAERVALNVQIRRNICMSLDSLGSSEVPTGSQRQGLERI